MQRCWIQRVAQTLKSVMAEVVDNGTAQTSAWRVCRYQRETSAHRWQDWNRRTSVMDEFGAGGRSAIVARHEPNRNLLLILYRRPFLGTITAHVAGDDAADYKFTQRHYLAQMLKALAPGLYNR